MTASSIIAAMERAAGAYREGGPIIWGASTTIIDDKDSGVQCYLARKGGCLYITFRGSDESRDWQTNLAFRKKTVPYGNNRSKIRVHSGFISAYKSDTVRGVIHGAMTPEICRVKISGHSLGAALAVLCAVDLEYNFPDRDYEAVLFGGPRVGNRAFRDSYNKRVVKTLRVENGNDLVAHLPFPFMGYRHVGARLHIGPVRVMGAFSRNDHRPVKYYEGLIEAKII